MRINKMISKGAAVFFLFLLCIYANGRTNSNTLSTQTVVDLTHTLTADFPFIPIPGITFPFKKTPIATIEKLGVAANRWEIHEHIGTQIDAPSHFFADGLSLDQMPVRNFIAPLAVIDISERARTDADTAVTIEDIKNWEKKYGRLPKGSAVFMYSGWDAKVNDAKAFVNMDGANTLHFPGFSPEAAEFLVRERDVVGIGVDTLSLDPGKDKEYKAHKVWLAAGKWGVECVANLKGVPASGATVFVGASKVGGATGGLVRLIAAFPSRQTETSQNAEQSVRDFSRRWNEMSATKNLSGMIGLYTADTLWLPPNEARSIGIDKVRENYARLFQASNLSLVHTTEKIVVSKSGDTANETGTYEISLDTPQGKFKDKGKYFFLLTKVGGEWKIAADMFNSDAPIQSNNSTVSTLRNQLLGTWKSAAAEPVGNIGFRTREFTFTPERWLIEVVFYSDKEMTKPLFTFVGEGPFTLAENSTVSPGATNATFFFDEKRLTLLTDDAAAVSAFKFDACNLTKGLTKDISASGCSNFTSVAVCGQEYDLVNIERDILRLGARPADGNMCSVDKRPKSLGQPLIKQNK